MRKSLSILMLMVAAQLLANSANAQGPGMPGFGIGSVAADPFNGYYSWFLPRQAAMAAQPTLNNQLNMYTSERVQNQMDNRSGNLGGLDLSSLGLAGSNGSDLNTDAPRNPRPRLSSTGPVVENSRGTGLMKYHARAGSYYPTMRTGTYRNNGLPPSRRGR
jgi:hypothetical protein